MHFRPASNKIEVKTKNVDNWDDLDMFCGQTAFLGPQIWDKTLSPSVADRSPVSHDLVSFFDDLISAKAVEMAVSSSEQNILNSVDASLKRLPVPQYSEMPKDDFRGDCSIANKSYSYSGNYASDMKKSNDINRKSDHIKM